MKKQDLCDTGKEGNVDFELAEMYGVETKRLNEQVRPNPVS